MLRPTRLALATLLLPGCLKTETTVNQNHCATQTGDAWCAEKHPAGDRAFCNAGPLDCSPPAEERPDGCVATRPVEDRCYSPCGDRATVLEDGTCLDPSGPTTETETTSSTTEDPDTETGPDTDTMDESTSTGPTGCQGPDDCQDAAAPFCVDEVCVPCSGATEPDVACAEFDPTIPLCVDDACVQCTDENADACGDVTPLCDTEAMTCVACEFHEQCQDLGLPACNIATGACFNADDVSQVNGGTDGSIQTAIDGIPDGVTHAIVLTNGGGDHTLTIDGGKTIAIVSSSDTEVRILQGNSGSPTITVTGDGTTAYLHRLQATLNGNDWGVSVESSATLYADSTQVVQNSGGGVQLASGTTGFIRNSMIGGAPNTVVFDAAAGATFDISYSTLGRGTNFGEPVLSCSGGAGSSLRNSIVVNQTNTNGDEIECDAELSNNDVLSDVDPTGLFTNFNGGAFFLTAAGQAQFAGVAVWQLGDPPFDFDGDARPTEDGASDYAGADVP